MSKRIIIHCPYCGKQAKVVPAFRVWPQRREGYAFVCRDYPRCDAYVGCHGRKPIPLGTMANRDLRRHRRNAHAAFDRIWRDGHMTRPEAYAWLAQRLGIERADCHIALFGEPTCRAVMAVSFGFRRDASAGKAVTS